jgi:hypothetical protein
MEDPWFVTCQCFFQNVGFIFHQSCWKIVNKFIFSSCFRQTNHCANWTPTVLIKQTESRRLFNRRLLNHVAMQCNMRQISSVASCYTKTSVHLFKCQASFILAKLFTSSEDGKEMNEDRGKKVVDGWMWGGWWQQGKLDDDAVGSKSRHRVT